METFKEPTLFTPLCHGSGITHDWIPDICLHRHQHRPTNRPVTSARNAAGLLPAATSSTGTCSCTVAWNRSGASCARRHSPDRTSWSCTSEHTPASGPTFATCVTRHLRAETSWMPTYGRTTTRNGTDPTFATYATRLSRVGTSWMHICGRTTMRGSLCWTWWWELGGRRGGRVVGKRGRHEDRCYVRIVDCDTYPDVAVCGNM